MKLPGQLCLVGAFTASTNFASGGINERRFCPRAHPNSSPSTSSNRTIIERCVPACNRHMRAPPSRIVIAVSRVVSLHRSSAATLMCFLPIFGRVPPNRNMSLRLIRRSVVNGCDRGEAFAHFRVWRMHSSSRCGLALEPTREIVRHLAERFLPISRTKSANVTGDFLANTLQPLQPTFVATPRKGVRLSQCLVALVGSPVEELDLVGPFRAFSAANCAVGKTHLPGRNCN